MAALAPLLTHLVPPVGFGGLRLDRFSPNFFDAERLGFRQVRPLPAYEYVYRVPPAALANLAYNFTFDYADGRRVGDYIPPLLRELHAWRSAGGDSTVASLDIGHALVIVDTRPVAKYPVTVLSDLDRRLYLQCDAIADVRRLAAIAGSSEGEVAGRLEPLCGAGLLLCDKGRYLALAVPWGDDYAPPAPALKRLRAVLAGIAEMCEQDLLVPLATLPRSSVQYAGRSPRTPPRQRRTRAPRFTRAAREQFELRGRHELVIRSPRTSRQFNERSV
jgi:hypothetical protein